MLVIDNFLPNPCRVRREALRADYIDWPGPDGEVYKRICITEIPGVREGIRKAIGREPDILGMGYRLNFNEELPNAAIHSDIGWGTHALVLYLSHGCGGTALWRHNATGAERFEPAIFEDVRHDWDEPGKWTQVGLCEQQFNRGVIYESALFHSRWPFEAAGTTPETGRLIAVAFFN